MGACGCGDGFGDSKFPGPDGTVYAVQVYTGCDYCNSPAGVSLFRYVGGAHGMRDLVNAAPDVPWGRDDGEFAEFFMAVMDPDVIREKREEFVAALDPVDDADLSAEDALAEFAGSECFVRDVAWESWTRHRKAWLASIAKAGEE